VIWPVFLAALWLALGLDVGLRDALQLGASAAPSLTLILVAFIAMWAPRLHAIYAAILAGLCLDLMGARVAPGATEAVTTIGPFALGCALGAYAVLTARAMVERTNLLALPAMTVMLAALAHVVVVFCFTVREAYDPAVAFDAAPELAARGLSALYSGAVAIPIGVILTPLARVFGFHTHSGRRPRP
jgi:hypothetical protein